MSDLDELRQAIVRWSTDYTEMDCNRVSAAKPLMDNLWRAIESLQRENEELKAELAARTHNYEYWREYAESLKAAAITPEMREKAEAALSEYVHWQRYGKCVEVVRDLLGEQG